MTFKLCPKCDSEHKKPGIFCSRRCANSRVFSEESNKKRSLSIKKAISKKSPEELAAQTKKAYTAWCKKRANELFITPFEDLSTGLKRKRVIIEQDKRCNKCGIDTWRGQPIVLELHHINGDHEDNNRENYEGLCPNCHSITDTWRKPKSHPLWKKLL